MKNICLFILTILSFQCYGQTSIEKAFDFWIGHWAVSWELGGTSGGGFNTITKDLQDKVIRENFSITKGNNIGFEGTSISVFNPKDSLWHQAWADNQGGYFDFYGIIDEDKRIFITQPRLINKQTIIQRMVFYNIKEDSLTWDWESSTDNGQTWQLQWRILYKRIKQ